jgi:integrase/recombinase XerD
MPIGTWPHADQAAFKDAFAPGGFLENTGRAAHMARATQISVENAYARWLAWVTAYCPQALKEPPGLRATEARVLAYLHHLRDELALRTIFGYACRLKVALEVVIAPEKNWAWLVPIIQRIEVHLRRQPRAPKPVIDSGDLLRHGIAMMVAAETDPDLPSVRRAECFRDGLLFAFLAACPLRRTNMVTLVLGRSLVEEGDGYRILIAAQEYKTRTAMECPLPADLAPWMRHYLTEHRPTLAQGPDAIADDLSLWLARSGAPLPPDTFADMISRETLTHFGLRMTPHDFRHCAATTITTAKPDAYMIIKIILGHATHRTAEAYYDHAKATQAGHAYQKTLQARRDAIPPAARRA